MVSYERDITANENNSKMRLLKLRILTQSLLRSDDCFPPSRVLDVVTARFLQTLRACICHRRKRSKSISWWFPVVIGRWFPTKK